MKGLKHFFLTILGIACAGFCMAQADTTAGRQSAAETTRMPPVDTQIVPVNPVRVSRPRAIRTDSLPVARDSSLQQDTILSTVVALQFKPQADTGTYRRYYTHPYLPLQKKAIFMVIDFHKRQPADAMFYLLAGVLFFLGFIRTAFPRYFKNLFILFFQTSLRQKQTRDQLLQDNLASLLSNLLFVISASLYAALAISNQEWLDLSFRRLVMYGAALLSAIYLVKYLFLRFSGWVFNSKEAAGNYIFIVFLVNKVMGIALIPFLLVLAFAGEPVKEAAISISAGLIGLLFFYRYLVSFSAIRSTLKVNGLHFFLYLCAIEVLPLLLLYKLLVNYIAGRL